jgi:hypothetical protein
LQQQLVWRFKVIPAIKTLLLLKNLQSSLLTHILTYLQKISHQTLVQSELLHIEVPNKRPQHMLMRAAVGIHSEDINATIVYKNLFLLSATSRTLAPPCSTLPPSNLSWRAASC